MVVFTVVAWAADGRLHGGGLGRGEGPGTAGHGLLAALAVPDAHRLALHVGLPAKRTLVLGVLLHLDLLHELAQAGAVPRAVLAGDADLLRAAGHWVSRALEPK